MYWWLLYEGLNASPVATPGNFLFFGTEQLFSRFWLSTALQMSVEK
jgi:hypothetical protein